MIKIRRRRQWFSSSPSSIVSIHGVIILAMIQIPWGMVGGGLNLVAMLLVLKKMLLSQGLELRSSTKRFLLLVLLESRWVLVMHIGWAWCLPNCCMTSLQGNYRSNLIITAELVQFVRLRRGKSSWNQAFCCSGMDIHWLMSSNNGMPHPISTSACIYWFRNRWYSYVNEGKCVLWAIAIMIEMSKNS